MKKNSIVLLSFCLIISGCANIVAPSGGEGIKTIPVVVNCSVKDGEINYVPKDIKIEFNSYMNRSVVIENLQIAPTIKYSFKWKAKTLNITLTEELKPNTTYSVSLSGKYVDHYGNIAESPFYSCFSTGDIIDSCKIEGIVYTANTTNYYVFCYIHRENIDYLNDKPDYKMLVGANGTFVIPALKDDKYIVLGVKDVDKDGMITNAKDTIAVPQFITKITDCSTKYVELIPNDVINPPPPIETPADTTELDTLEIDTTELIDTNIYLHISGKVIDTNFTNNRYLIFTQKEKKLTKQAKINEDNTFLCDSVLAGEYEIMYFIDANDNGIFDKGTLVPFELCEPFKKIPQPLKLNNRWSIDNYIIEINEPFNDTP